VIWNTGEIIEVTNADAWHVTDATSLLDSTPFRSRLLHPSRHRPRWAWHHSPPGKFRSQFNSLNGARRSIDLAGCGKSRSVVFPAQFGASRTPHLPNLLI
jgi:hypothetical protein